MVDCFFVSSGTLCPLPTPNAGTESNLNLCESCVCCQGSMNSYVHWFCCVWQALFPWSHLFPLISIIVLSPLRHSFLNSKGRLCIKTSHLKSVFSKSLTYFLYIVYLCLSVLVAIFCNRNFL